MSTPRRAPVGAIDGSEGQRLGPPIDCDEARADTQLFVDDHDYDVMEDAYGEAMEELETFEGVGTDGQQGDAAVLADLSAGGMTPHLTEASHTFDEFLARHDLELCRPAGPDSGSAGLSQRDLGLPLPLQPREQRVEGLVALRHPGLHAGLHHALEVLLVERPRGDDHPGGAPAVDVA